MAWVWGRGHRRGFGGFAPDATGAPEVGKPPEKHWGKAPILKLCGYYTHKRKDLGDSAPNSPAKGISSLWNPIT